MPHAESPPSAATKAEPIMEGVALYANDGLLAAPEAGRLRESRPDEPDETLRARYEADGYLFVRGAVPRADVLAARRAYFEGMAHTGVLAPGTDPVEGRFRPGADAADYPSIGTGFGTGGANGRPGQGATAEAFVDAALAAHSADWYRGKPEAEETGEEKEKGGSRTGFAYHPAVTGFVARLTGWGPERTYMMRRSLLRNSTPGNPATGVHYDQIFLRQGEPTSVTAWVPMGDVTLEGGGLMYLEGSAGIGADLEREFGARARAAGMPEDQITSGFNAHMESTGMLSCEPRAFAKAHGGRRWLVTDYRAGDVVFHKPTMIHASTINTDPNRIIRLGTDLRLVDKSRLWDQRWDHTFYFGDGV